MTRALTLIAVLLFCRSAFALTAAQIQFNYDSAREQYTIPEGVHELETFIRVRSNKRLLAHYNSTLIARGNHYVLYADGAKNFHISLGRVIHLSRENSGYSTVAYLRNCENFTLSNTQIEGGWAGITLVKCRNFSAHHVAANRASYSTGWRMAGCHDWQLIDCDGNENGWDGLRLIADNSNGKVFGGNFCYNGRVLPTSSLGTAGSGIEVGQGGVNIVFERVNCSHNIALGIVIKTSQLPEKIYTEDVPFGECKEISVRESTCNNNGSHGIYVQWGGDRVTIPQPANLAFDGINASGNGESGIWVDANRASVTNSILKRNKDGLILFRTCKDWSESGNVTEKNTGYQKFVPTDY
jgi:hypothetical protein